MDMKLEHELCTKYPKIFTNPSKVGDEDQLYWGIECNAGWYNIIDTLCATIQDHIDHNRNLIQRATEEQDIPTLAGIREIPQVEVLQIKEKFGTLRFYYSGGDVYVEAAVTLAERLSARTCEDCGAVGERRSGGWIKVLCDEHAD